MSRRRQRQLTMLLGFMTVSAFAEVISLGAALPFFGVLISPDRVFERPMIGSIARTLGITSGSQLALALTIAFALAALIAGGIRLLVLWASTRLSFAVGVDMSSSMYRRTLYQPYSVHVTRNSSAVISGITTKTSTVVSGVLMPALFFMSSTVVLAAVVTALIAIDPLVAFWAAAGFGFCYAVVAVLTRRRLLRNSQRVAAEQSKLFQTLQEGLGGIRDVLLNGTQPHYLDAYHKASHSLRVAQSSISFISASPRFAMESLGITLLAILAYAVSNQKGGISEALPVLGALAVGAQRLIPALQQLFSSWSLMVGSRASLVDALGLLDQPLPAEAYEPPPAPLSFNKAIRFANVSFRYGAEAPWVLVRVDLCIPKGARVGFVGTTGSGKSTAMDLLMGLLEPTEGQVLVDDQAIIGRHVRAWQQNIAHVPQSVYLADASVAENIAFGVPLFLIDMARVQLAARHAQIADFFEASPEGYQTMVGERGIRLSGGQRQRIGIARALYKQAMVLVFDEATSALDTVTEKAVMDAIESLDRDLTILVIAHRLATVQRCDVILELDQGKVVAQGTYEDLLRDSETFRAMAKRPTLVGAV